MAPRDAYPDTGRWLVTALNREAAHVTSCVWPDCGRSLQHYQLGPLCAIHADAVTEAVTWMRERTIGEPQAAAVRRRRDEQAAAAQRTRSRGRQPGWIYYVRIGDRIKIGYSADVKRRMRAYPPDSHLLAVHPGTPQLETEMHQKFAGSRAAGREWFRETLDLVEHIAAVVEQFGDPRQHRHRYRGATAV